MFLIVMLMIDVDTGEKGDKVQGLSKGQQCIQNSHRLAVTASLAQNCTLKLHCTAIYNSLHCAILHQMLQLDSP